MSKHQYSSKEVFLKRMRRDKEKLDKAYKTLSFEEKLRQLVKLQEKAWFMGKMKFKPWPIK